MSAAANPSAASRQGSDSLFEASAFDRGDARPGWIGWRRRALALAAFLGCLGLFSLARWMAETPQVDARWQAGQSGELLLRDSPLPALQGRRGQAVTALGRADGAMLEVDALLLHRSPRWQPDDDRRARQISEHRAVAAQLAAAGGQLQLRFADGTHLAVPVQPLGYRGLSLLFWPLAGLALMLYLLAVVLLLGRPQPRGLLFAAMALCQAGNLLLTALSSGGSLSLPEGLAALDMPLHLGFDLATAAAGLNLFLLHPRHLPRARAWASAGWALALLCLVSVSTGLAAPSGGAWWWAQACGLALGAGALAAAGLSHRSEANPYALVMRRMASAALATLALSSLAVATTAGRPALAAVVATGSSILCYGLLACLLMLTPFLARSRQMLHEFALLAGVSTVATSLDLLFVAVFSLGTFTSLTMAVFIGLGLYAAVRQWMLNHLIGSSMLTTERTFDQLYRAAREVQARPARYPVLLMQLLRELFEPLELLRVDRVPVRSRVIGGGSALVVPMRGAEDDATPAPAVALVLRFAQRGQRLFTLDDARLADRVVDQLRRAVAYDRAVERGRFEERQRIAQDLHDDIGARLLTLMYQAQTPEMEDYIRHTLKDLKTLTRGLAAAEHHLTHAAAEWKADLTQRLTAAHVDLGWNFQCDSDLPLTVVEWSALTRVLRELVSNSLFHGHASRIDIDFRLVGPELTLRVADDGIGRDPKAWAHGLGLGGVRKRVKVLGGEVAWRENGERGIVCQMRVSNFHERPPGPP